jgi:RND family efflux transporter MFP subunit
VVGDRAAVALARNRVEYALLRAPTDGVVTAVLADPGTVVAEGTPVLRLASADPPELEANLPESELAEIAHADASMSFWAHPETTRPVRLREIAAQADHTLRTYQVRFTIPDPPPWAAFGMTATLRLVREGGPEAATLPAAAILDRGFGPIVWTVDGDSGRLTEQPVALRALKQETATVSGLAEGALVVSLGSQKLDPAMRVRIAEIRPAPAAAPESSR